MSLFEIIAFCALLIGAVSYLTLLMEVARPLDAIGLAACCTAVGYMLRLL